MVSCDKQAQLTPAPIGEDGLPFHKEGSSYLDIEEFRENVNDAFKGNVVGYGWAVYQGGKLIGAGGDGFAREPGPQGVQQKYTANTFGTVFSTSKTITAAAAVEQLSQLGLSLDLQIKDFLPDGWRMHPTQEHITFRDLLAHTSGLLGTVDGYTDMRDSLLIPNRGNPGTYRYSNFNYTLFRVLIPYLFWDVELNMATQQGDNAAIDFCAEKYESFIRSRLSQIPVPGHQNIDTNYPYNQLMAWYYDYQDLIAGAAYGAPMFDCHDISGAGGWFMTPIQYAAFIDGLFNGKVVSETDLEVMKSENLGMYAIGPFDYGIYYTHNGGAPVSGSKGGQCQWMHFPEQNISFFIAWNSSNNNLPVSAAGRDSIQLSIFENAWVE